MWYYIFKFGVYKSNVARIFSIRKTTNQCKGDASVTKKEITYD